MAEVFDEKKTEWNAEYQELKALLSNEEYEAARASTLNAHYTSPTIIKGIYNALEKIGFKKGSIWNQRWELETSLECYQIQ